MEQKTRLDLNMLVIQRMGELPRSPSGIIRFPAVFEKLCRNFSINKKQCWELLFSLKEQGFIEIVPYQGIRLLS
jgi:hypothetical protein